jgi:predicted ribosome-associated RNA-binding protein Tma20
MEILDELQSVSYTYDRAKLCKMQFKRFENLLRHNIDNIMQALELMPPEDITMAIADIRKAVKLCYLQDDKPILTAEKKHLINSWRIINKLEDAVKQSFLRNVGSN